jgi:peptidoglycan hydrolase-like protein with peptidoglycan-binding domain
MAHGGADADHVKALQQALKDQGNDPGDIDGVMGPKTKAALRDYQQKNGLKATGQPDSETMAKLGVGSKTSAAGSSSGSSPAASPSTSSTGSDTKSKADSSMKSDSGAKTGKSKQQ